MHFFVFWLSAFAFNFIYFFDLSRYSRSVIGLLYMLLAVLVHWDFFPIRYHLNHHYYVTKNYGSHVMHLSTFLFNCFAVGS